MKAIQVHRFGGEEVLQLDEVPVPSPGGGELLIKVHAASVNHSDLFIRRDGNVHIGPQDLPLIPGRELAGTVVEVGDSVDEFTVGQNVVALPAVQTRAAGTPGGKEYTGCYAEYALARPQDTRLIPDGIDMVVAAAIPWVSLTAWYTMTRAGKLRAGESVLIHAGGSGVGVAGIQLARYIGARVFTTAGSAEKCERARALGAELAINYVEQDFASEILDETRGRGVDVVIDSVGGDVFAKDLHVLAPHGRVIVFGASGGPIPNPLPKLADGRVVRRFSITEFLMADPHAIQQVDEFFRLVVSGDLLVVVDRVFPLADAVAAQRYVEERRNFGKVVLTMDQATRSEQR
jgi:NADPH2:quinone reductase